MFHPTCPPEYRKNTWQGCTESASGTQSLCTQQQQRQRTRLKCPRAACGLSISAPESPERGPTQHESCMWMSGFRLRPRGRWGVGGTPEAQGTAGTLLTKQEPRQRQGPRATLLMRPGGRGWHESCCSLSSHPPTTWAQGGHSHKSPCQSGPPSKGKIGSQISRR